MTQETVIEKSVHELVRQLAKEVWATHGICIQTVQFSWIDISSIQETNMIVDEVSMTTSTRVGPRVQ